MVVDLQAGVELWPMYYAAEPSPPGPGVADNLVDLPDDLARRALAATKEFWAVHNELRQWVESHPTDDDF